jgi:hypothetical protein
MMRRCCGFAERPAFFWRMANSENRLPLFRIML